MKKNTRHKLKRFTIYSEEINKFKVIYAFSLIEALNLISDDIIFFSGISSKNKYKNVNILRKKVLIEEEKESRYFINCLFSPNLPGTTFHIVEEKF